MTTGTIELKKAITSSKFGIVYPANTSLKVFVDSQKRIYAEHPTCNNAYMLIKEANIKTVKWNNN